MKILCLHAMGTSADILEKQLAPLKHALGDDHEWVSVDGPCEHAAHSSVLGRSPGPFYCYHETLSAREQAEAHAFIEEVIEDDGPFDGILGFSQGASLATSFLLQRRIDKPREPCPFKFAILFNANLVVSPDEHFCEDEIVKEAAKAQKTSRFSFPGKKDSKRSAVDAMNGKRTQIKSISKHRIPGKKSEVVDEVLGLLNLSLDAAEKEGWMDRATAFEGKTVDDFPRIVHPMMLETRIQIPTAIIVGKEDPLYLCGLVQKRLCTKGMRKFALHAGGHDIPRAGQDLDVAVESCKWAIGKAQMAAMGGAY